MAVRCAFFAAIFEIGQFFFKTAEVDGMRQSLKTFEQGRCAPKRNITDKTILLMHGCLAVQQVRRRQAFSGLTSLNTCFQGMVLLHPRLPMRLALGPGRP